MKLLVVKGRSTSKIPEEVFKKHYRATEVVFVEKSEAMDLLSQQQHGYDRVCVAGGIQDPRSALEGLKSVNRVAR